MLGLKESLTLPEHVEHEAIYRRLLAQFEGTPARSGDLFPALQQRQRADRSIAHRLAAQFLDMPPGPWSDSTSEALRDMVHDRAGYLDTTHLKLKDGSIASRVRALPHLRVPCCASSGGGGRTRVATWTRQEAMMRSRIVGWKPVHNAAILRIYNSPAPPAPITIVARRTRATPQDRPARRTGMGRGG